MVLKVELIDERVDRFVAHEGVRKRLLDVRGVDVQLDHHKVCAPRLTLQQPPRVVCGACVRGDAKVEV
eukprot:6496537-Prymnesium_polylepis.1